MGENFVDNRLVPAIVTLLAIAFGVIYDWLATQVFGPGFTGGLWFNPVFIFGEAWILFTGVYIYVAGIKDPDAMRWPQSWWFCLLACGLILFCLPFDAVMVVIMAMGPFFLTFAVYTFGIFTGPFNLIMTTLLYMLACLFYAILMYARFPTKRLPWWKTLLFPFQGAFQVHIYQLKRSQRAVHHEHYNCHLEHLGSQENVFGRKPDPV